MIDDLPNPTTPRPGPPVRSAWRRLRGAPQFWLGLAVAGLFVALAIGADYLAPYRANETFWSADATGAVAARDHLRSPSWRHPLGTDGNDYDVLARVIYGARLSLAAGAVSILLAVLVGAPLGLAAGYFGGWPDALLMRAIDVLLAFPGILIAFLVLLALPRGWVPVIIAVGVINVPIFARQVRATVLALRDFEFVVAARAIGASDWYILTRVLAPQCLSPIVVLAALGLGGAIIEVAGLSFLGVGGDGADAEWGAMLNDAKDHLQTSLWPALGPGLAISLSVLGFNLLGDALRDALDPRG